MLRNLTIALALAATMTLAGCCSCAETYGPFLHHVETSLRDSVAPTLDAALEKSGRPADLRANDVGEVTDLADACERVRTMGADAWQPGAQPVAEEAK